MSVCVVGQNKSAFMEACANAGGVGTKLTDSLDGADGVIMVYDLIEGMTIEDETVLRKALIAGLRASIFVDNLDKALEKLDPEGVYQACVRGLDNVNVVLSTYSGAVLGDLQVYPDFKGGVAFGSASQGWGFTVRHFAKMYAKKMGIPERKMCDRLWGDNFFWAKKKTWVYHAEPEGVTLPRAFVQFILAPIVQLSQAILTNNSRYEQMLTALNISLSASDKGLTGQALLTRVMQSWMASDHLSLLLVPIKDRVMTTFSKFDKNGDGRISCSELSALMQQLDPSWSGGDLTKLMAQSDDNGDGTLDPEEFVQFVFSPTR
ncbi:unnamed protein product [Symbiodinium sp. CCMP2592]|nr:unnamed protein product [Symbiodinium sp. CCMP2592]